MGSSNILLNHQISAEIISLIEATEKYCFLVTPYYKPWTLLNRTIDKAAASGKQIIFIFRAGHDNEVVAKTLNKQGFDVHLVERLHTKLYLNERIVIISSMNLYDSSKDNNYEVGYKIKSAVEAKQFREEVIEKDILGLLPKKSFTGRYAIELQRLEKEKLDKENKLKEEILAREKLKKELASNSIIKERKISYKDNYGYCIRCHTQIPLNPNTPYCMDCYKVWVQFQNVDYQEQYCHSCGSSGQPSMDKPLCYNCYKDYERKLRF